VLAFVVMLVVVALVVAIRCGDGNEWGPSWGVPAAPVDTETADRLREADALLLRVYGPPGRSAGPETVNRYLLDPVLREDIGEYLRGTP